MVKLEYFTEQDFGQLIRWIDTEDLKINWSGPLFSFPVTEEDLKWYIQDSNDPSESEVLIYKAVDRPSGETIGHISLGSISRKNRSARISRVLVGQTCSRGKGYCGKIIREILKVGFDELHLHRISLGVYQPNQAAIKCYQRVGFSIDGVLRDNRKVNDTYWSLVEMSILEDEWKEIKEKRHTR